MSLVYLLQQQDFRAEINCQRDGPKFDDVGGQPWRGTDLYTREP
jgi:hypothetical protein